MAIPNPNPNIADGIKSDNKTYSSNKIESLIQTATELPIPEAGDAGKVLTVNSDADGYELDTIPSELPTPEAGDAGKLVAVNEDLGYTLDPPPVIPAEIGVYDTGVIKFSDLTFTQSGNGIYYSTIDLDSDIPADKNIIAVSISGWSNLRASDFIIPYIRTNRTLGIMTPVGTFADANSSINLKVLYK